MNIKKKLIVLTAILTIFTSFAGCSDKDNSSETADAGNSSSVVDNANNVEEKDNNDNNNDDNDDNDEVVTQAETLSSEEYEAVAKHNLTIEPFVPEAENEIQQDPVENIVDSVGGDSNSTSTTDSNSETTAGSTTPVVADDDLGENNADLPADTGLKVHNGTRTTMQAWWMDLSRNEDYLFNGEYLVAEFKIKDGTADGIYPVTLDWLDFANWDCKTVKFKAIDGAVVVGGEATENVFDDGTEPQVMVSNVEGKAGETVAVAINVKNNPGVVGNILRFSYNSDVLEFVSAGEGADFDGQFS